MPSVEIHLQEIARIADEELSERTGPAPEDHEYRQALESMDELGGERAVDELAEELKRSIRKSETLPQDQSVRSLGRDILDERGTAIPERSWFAR